MIDFSTWLNLPFIWGLLIVAAVFLYVVLDGFDLGCGILFPFAPSDPCRNRIMNSIAPFWDGNETWLVFTAGGLFVAFPVAYAILMPAFYLPIMLMLMGLIFRGVALEFRFKANETRKVWDIAFHGGSILATFMQGVILGNFVQGIEVSNRAFSGGSLDWANGFAMTTGIALVFGYALLGSTWLIMKTEGETQAWARNVAKYVLAFVGVFMAIVSIAMPFIDQRILTLWFSTPNIYYLSLVPLLTTLTFLMLWHDLYTEKRETRPFLLSLALFLLAYIGFGISLYPWVVPFELTIWDAAATASTSSQSIVLIGTVILLPIILSYTAYSYYIFRGKSDSKAMY